MFLSQSLVSLHCEVCGEVINHAQTMKLKDKDYRVCHDFDCIRIIKQRGSMSPVTYASHIKFQRKLLQQNREWRAENKRRIEQLTTLHEQQQQDILQVVLATNTQLDHRTPVVVIPSGLSKVTRLPESRIEDYLQHLHTIIEEAANYESIDDLVQDQHYDAKHKLISIESKFAANPELRIYSDRLCTQCRGGCCVSGNEHAYLSAFSMRQQIDRNPPGTPYELLELYRKFINTDTIEGSCINHTPNGCALPRDLRSSICNAFYCDTLIAFQNDSQQKQPEDLMVFQRSETYSSSINPSVDNEITRLVFMQQNSTREVDCESGELQVVEE